MNTKLLSVAVVGLALGTVTTLTTPAVAARPQAAREATDEAARRPGNPPAHVTSVNDCADLREIQESGGLRLSIDNGCGRELACVLSWTLRCESATGRTTRETRASARVTVSASASEAAFASAATCGDNWTIANVSWDCRRTD